jgi:hypothetical protein
LATKTLYKAPLRLNDTIDVLSQLPHLFITLLCARINDWGMHPMHPMLISIEELSI